MLAVADNPEVTPVVRFCSGVYVSRHILSKTRLLFARNRFCHLEQFSFPIFFFFFLFLFPLFFFVLANG